MGLAARVRKLHPNAIAVRLCGCRPVAQRRQLLGALPALNNDIAWVFEVAIVDLHIACEHHARSGLSPSAVERHVRRRCPVAGVGQQLRHRGFDEAVRQNGAAGQG